MFRNVLGCSMFLLLSTTRVLAFVCHDGGLNFRDVISASALSLTSKQTALYRSVLDRLSKCVGL